MVRPRDTLIPLGRIEWDELLACLGARDLDIIESYYFYGLTDKAIGQRYKRTQSWAGATRKKILRNLYAELTKKEEVSQALNWKKSSHTDYLVKQFFQQAKGAISVNKLRRTRIEEKLKRREADRRKWLRQYKREMREIKRAIAGIPKKLYHPGVGHRSPRGEAPPPQYRYTPEGGWVPAFKYTADGWVKAEDEDTASRHPTPEPLAPS